MKERLHRLCLVPAVLVILPLASCTHEAGQARPAVGGDSAQASEGDGAPASFLANVEAVRSSPAYRQNCWMIPKGGGDDSTSAALCIDLKQQVHLVVFSKRVPRKISGKMREYEVSASRLRASMDPDAFVLDDRGTPLAGIFRVPENCPESFGSDAINSLLGTRWKPGNFGFQYD